MYLFFKEKESIKYHFKNVFKILFFFEILSKENRIEIVEIFI